MIRFSLQAIAVLLVSAFLAYLTDYIGFRSAWNALWIFGLPIMVAVIANNDAGSRSLASLFLMLASLIGMVAAAAVFGLGP